MNTLRLLLPCVGLVSLVAWADIPPADTAGCNDKTAGAACTKDDGSAGTCASATCTRNDYSEGPPPKRVEAPCLKCSGEAAKKSCSVTPGLSALAALAWLGWRRGTRRERR